MTKCHQYYKKSAVQEHQGFCFSAPVGDRHVYCSALCHILWVIDTEIVFLTAVELLGWNKTHQDLLLNIYCQHGENKHAAAVIHSLLELWVN